MLTKNSASAAVKSNVNDIDLSMILNSGMEHMNGCSAQYSSVYRNFCEFMLVEYTGNTWPDKELFTDENIAKFSYCKGHDGGFKPHTKKTIVSAINDMLKKHGLHNIYEHKHMWPKVHQIIDVRRVVFYTVLIYFPIFYNNVSI